jgi:homoserine kinase
MDFTRAEAFAPATMANVGCGFDILGLCLEAPGDRVVAVRRPEPGVVIAAVHGDGGKLTRDPLKNSAGAAAKAVLDMLGVREGVLLTIYKDMPLASGLGSSSASAVAGALAVNALFGLPLSKAELIPAAVAGEGAVSGFHADNVAPCLMGGVVLISGTTADTVLALPVPQDAVFALVTPHVAVPTALARAALPKEVPMKQMIHMTAAVGRLIAALYRGDLRALAEAMEADVVVEPARRHLMPHLDECRQVAKAAGALGLCISGAGPTLGALCDSVETAERVSAAMDALYIGQGMGVSVRTSRISTEGARVLGVE